MFDNMQRRHVCCSVCRNETVRKSHSKSHTVWVISFGLFIFHFLHFGFDLCVFEIFICKMQYVDTHAQIYTDTHTQSLSALVWKFRVKNVDWSIERNTNTHRVRVGERVEATEKKINEANTLTEPKSWNVFVLDCDENQLKYWPIERSIEYEFWTWWMIVMCTTTTTAIHIEKCPRSCHIWNVLKLTVIWTLRQHRKR